MRHMIESTERTGDEDTAVVARYTAVWNQRDALVRRQGIAELWVDNGVEYVEGARFEGLAELDTRITEAYDEFVGSGKYRVTHADDARRSGDIVSFTIQLVTGTGEIDWAARVFLILDGDGRIREDYQLTTRPLAAA
ncbi:hypothetical protein ABIA39_000016 [Nocardia sp. GAS34]|uniref:hypothetical protein n=1 Tax=unclassified Nocardia TaxID=2637762 RepID=UPI003D245792